MIAKEKKALKKAKAKIKQDKLLKHMDTAEKAHLFAGEKFALTHGGVV